MPRRVGYVPVEPFLEHVEPPGHPERRARVDAVREVLDAMEGLHPLPTHAASDAQLLAVHSQRHLDRVRAVAGDGGGYFDPDTFVSPGSERVARLAAGSLCGLVDAVVAREVDTAWCLARPPGHHATSDVPMGFCLYNSVAVAARHAQAVHGAKSVLILDWDVHHGNGTQSIFWEDPTVPFYSSHQMPLYPGTGGSDERGAHGTVVNVPLRAGDGDDALLAGLEDGCGPLFERHRPDVVLVSAGFDAHVGDGLSGTRVSTEGFAAATAWVFARAAGRPVIFCLEGGYDLPSLQASVQACLTVSLDRP